MKIDKWKKILGCLLATTISLVGISNVSGIQKVEAAEGIVAKSINMKLSDNTIAGIDAPTSTKDTAESWSGDYIYFGTYNGSPVKFRVLNQRETNFGATTLLLDSDAILKQLQFRSSNTPTWSSSALKTWLNGTSSGQFLETFTQEEQSAIAGSTKASAVGAGDFPSEKYQYVALSGEKVFALDASEANYSGYGYANDATRMKEGGIGEYWLRSKNPKVSDAIGSVYTDGNIYHYYFPKYEKVGASPAMNIDLDAVLFASAYNVAKADAFNKVETSVTNEWKLTVKASDTGLSAATENDTTFYVDRAATDVRTLNITHTAANASLSTASQVSAVLTDAVGNVVYYGKVNTDVTATASTIEIADDLEAGNYNLYVFAEQVNGVTATDYASPLGEAIAITVQSSANVTTGTVTVVNGSGSGTYEVGATVEIRANMAESGKQFAKWEVTAGTLELDETQVSSSVTSFTMPEGDVTLTAVYDDITETSDTGDYAKFIWIGLFALVVVLTSIWILVKRRVLKK